VLRDSGCSEQRRRKRRLHQKSDWWTLPETSDGSSGTDKSPSTEEQSRVGKRIFRLAQATSRISRSVDWLTPTTWCLKINSKTVGMPDRARTRHNNDRAETHPARNSRSGGACRRYTLLRTGLASICHPPISLAAHYQYRATHRKPKHVPQRGGKSPPRLQRIAPQPHTALTHPPRHAQRAIPL
jgi:hypothetical protein